MQDQNLLKMSPFTISFTIFTISYTIFIWNVTITLESILLKSHSISCPFAYKKVMQHILARVMKDGISDFEHHVVSTHMTSCC